MKAWLCLGVWLTLFGGAHAETCRATWYKQGFRTANGERFNPMGYTAAHLHIPFGTRLLVTYMGRSVIVRVNDRGPARWTGNCLDLAQGAARKIDLHAGIVTFKRIN